MSEASQDKHEQWVREIGSTIPDGHFLDNDGVIVKMDDAQLRRSDQLRQTHEDDAGVGELVQGKPATEGHLARIATVRDELGYPDVPGATRARASQSPIDPRSVLGRQGTP